MYTIIISIHVFVSILLILAVLLQSGKESDLSSAFGGGGSSEGFGPATPENVLNKITTVLVVIFFFTSITLTIMSKNRTGSSILNNIPANTAPITNQKDNSGKIPSKVK